MQNSVLIGVGAPLVVTAAVIVVAISVGGVAKQLALELNRLILPPALGSRATIVGALFVAQGRGEP